MLVVGLADGFKTQEIMEFGILVFKIMKSGFNCTNLEKINSRKLLNLLFQHISPINDLTNATIVPIVFPMSFL